MTHQSHDARCVLALLQTDNKKKEKDFKGEGIKASSRQRSLRRREKKTWIRVPAARESRGRMPKSTNSTITKAEVMSKEVSKYRSNKARPTLLGFEGIGIGRKIVFRKENPPARMRMPAPTEPTRAENASKAALCLRGK